MTTGTDARAAPAAAAAWGTGMLVTAGGTTGSVAVGALVCLACAAVLLVAGRWFLDRRGAPAPSAGPTVRATAALALVAVAAVATSGAVHLAAREAALAALEDAGAVVGQVSGDPRQVGHGRTLVRLRLGVVERPGSSTAVPAVEVLVRGGSGWTDVRHGATVRARGTVDVLAGERAVAVLGSTMPPEVLAAPVGTAEVVNRLREGLVGASSGLPPDPRGLVPGTAVGDTRAVPADLTQAMRDTGLAHVTAVSGAHFSVVLSTLLGLGGLLRLPPVIRAGLTLGGAVGFVVLVHPAPSVLRAAVMGVVVVLGLVLGRPARAVPALCWAVVGLVCWDPWTARDVGFHLSVLATAAIVLLAPALAARMPGPRALATVVAVPAAAQAACGPVLVLLDPVVPLYAVPANVLALPAILPGTLAGVLATVLGPFAPAASAVCVDVAGGAARWLAGVARGLAALPGARVPWPAGSGGGLLLALVTVALVWVVLRLVPRRDAD